MITCYPDKNSLKQVFNTELSISTLKYMCKKNGIFLLSNNKASVIDTAHLFYWGFEDINQISQCMENMKNYKKAFRLTLDKKTSFVSEGDCSTFQGFFALVSSYRTGIAPRKGITFERFVIEQGKNQSAHLKATVEYKKKRKGRVKLLDEISQHFSFDAFEENDKIIIDVVFEDHNSVQVAKAVIANSVTGSDEFDRPKQISLRELTISERVELFDLFFAYHLKDWKIEAVKNIKVQTSEQYDTDENEEEAEEAENNFLSGIESALFSGSGLRTNPIVIDAVNRGYFFPKATVMLEHRCDALKLLLDISFNTDELLLELSIISTYEVEDDRIYKHPIPPEDQEDILQYFHGVLADIFMQLVSQREDT